MRVLRNVGSCMRGEQEATMTRLSFSLVMSSLTRFWPGSEHMYVYSRETATPGSFEAYSTTAGTSTTEPMLMPQWQIYTPIFGL